MCKSQQMRMQSWDPPQFSSFSGLGQHAGLLHGRGEEGQYEWKTPKHQPNQTRKKVLSGWFGRELLPPQSSAARRHEKLRIFKPRHDRDAEAEERERERESHNTRGSPGNFFSTCPVLLSMFWGFFWTNSLATPRGVLGVGSWGFAKFSCRQPPFFFPFTALFYYIRPRTVFQLKRGNYGEIKASCNDAKSRE